MSRLPVAVVGASGFLGAELVRLLASHPRVELTLVCGGSTAGRQLADVRPALASLGHVLEAVDPVVIAARSEVALLALPHGESAALVAQLLPAGRRVIDLGSDFRLTDAEDYPRYYQRQHPHPELLQHAHYSLPELTGPPSADCTLVANPGCFATAMALATIPLVSQLADDARLSISGVTGSSGSGAAPSPRVHHALRPTNFAAYKPLVHQHLGELYQTMHRLCGRRVAVDFVPHSGPFVRGIHLTVFVRRTELARSPLQLLRQAYDDSPLVAVQAGPVDLGSVVGTCRVALGVVEQRSTAIITVAIDNLLKGGSGQAVQNLNLLQGWPETLGLPLLGAWP